MAHFVQLDENNIVLNTIVVSNDKLLDENGVEQEQLGINFCKSCYGQSTIWKQTSYNGTTRYNYGQKGFRYDESADAFIGPQPFNSWTLDTNYNWVSPLTKPDVPEGKVGYYAWDEELYQSDNTQGWIFIDRDTFYLTRTATP